MPYLAFPENKEDWNDDGSVMMTRRSMLSGKVATHLFGPGQIDKAKLDAFKSGRLMVQDAFPLVRAEWREFIMTGSTPDEWDEHFKNDDDEEE